jgi:hypothetical protein
MWVKQKLLRLGEAKGGDGGGEVARMHDELTADLAAFASLGKPWEAPDVAPLDPLNVRPLDPAINIPLVETLDEAGAGKAEEWRAAGSGGGGRLQADQDRLLSDQLLSDLLSPSGEGAHQAAAMWQGPPTAGSGTATAPTLGKSASALASVCANGTAANPAAAAAPAPCAPTKAPAAGAVETIAKAFDNISLNAGMAEDEIRRGGDDDRVKRLKMR